MTARLQERKLRAEARNEWVEEAAAMVWERKAEEKVETEVRAEADAEHWELADLLKLSISRFPIR